MIGNGKIRILLADDDRMVREGLRMLFERQADLEVIGENDGGTEALGAIRELEPDIVLVSVAVPGASSIGAIRQMCQERAETRVIALSAFCNRVFVGKALKAGVRGYVARQSAFDELLKAIRAVHSGLTYLCSQVREEVLADYTRVSCEDRDPPETVLTERECTVLQLLADGKTSKQIATILELSSKTIDACRRELMRKLDVGSMAELVKYAILMGMTAATP